MYDILDGITFETAFERPVGAAHTIAEILLHMISWTEEVIDRMNDKSAGLPDSGDWPETGNPDEQKWPRWVNDLKLVNANLSETIIQFPEERWNEPIIDERNPELGTGVSFEALIQGLIQHHVYHSGQIALLKKNING